MCLWMLFNAFLLADPRMEDSTASDLQSNVVYAITKCVSVCCFTIACILFVEVAVWSEVQHKWVYMHVQTNPFVPTEPLCTISTLLASFPWKPIISVGHWLCRLTFSNACLLLWVELVPDLPILCSVPYILCRHVLVAVTTERSSVPPSMKLSPSERTLLGFFTIVSAWVINKDTLDVCQVGCRESNSFILYL